MIARAGITVYALGEAVRSLLAKRFQEQRSLTVLKGSAKRR